MTGAYAQEWPGRGAREQTWSRDCGSEGEHGRHRGGRHGRGGRRGRPDFPIEALRDWAMAKGRGPGGLDPDDLEHIEQLIALRRMRGGRGGPFGRGPRGPRGRGRRRRGDVRLAVLRLLAEEPRNGYQLMQAIEERSGGQWRPSPGSMYPTLSQLEDEGMIAAEAQEGGRRFHLADAGRADLEARAGEPDPWTPDPDADEHAMGELGPQVIGIAKAVWQVAAVADETQRAQATELLADTQRKLYGILAQDPEQPRDTGAGDDSEESVS